MPNQEALEWMLSRPDCIKELMKKIPPGCTVKLKSSVEICEHHEELRVCEWSVVSYRENGTVGIATFDGLHSCHCFPDELEIIRYFTNDHDEVQTQEWVEQVLSTGG